MTTAAIVLGLAMMGAPVGLIGGVAVVCFFAEMFHPYK
jgi:hypothetical protein